MFYVDGELEGQKKTWVGIFRVCLQKTNNLILDLRRGEKCLIQV